MYYELNYHNEVVATHEQIPDSMFRLVPPPSQFPYVEDILDYYQMSAMNPVEYLEKSNAIKTEYPTWLLKAPKGEVWFPLFQGEGNRQTYRSLVTVGNPCGVTMSGLLYHNKRTLDVLPKCIVPYLQQGAGRFSTVTGTLYDLAPYPGERGLIGRIVLNFPTD